MITILNKFDDGYIIGDHNVEQNIKDIHDITSVFLKMYGIDDKEIKLSNDSGIICAYDYYSNYAMLNAEKALEESMKFASDFPEEYRSYYVNYYFLYFIHYLVMHLVQSQMYGQQNSDNPLRYLYDVSEKSSQNGIVTCNESILTPMEIEARNMARKRAWQIMRSTKLPMKDVALFHYYYLSMLIEKYGDDGLSPIEMMPLDNTNIDLEKLFQLMENTGIGIKDRINLGLPVSPFIIKFLDFYSQKTLSKTIYHK